MTLYPRGFGPGGIISLFCASYPVSLLSLGIFGLFLFPIPCRFLFLGYIRPASLSYTLPLHFPWVYSTYWDSLYPASSLFLGIICLFCLSTPRSLNHPGAIMPAPNKKPASDDAIVMRQAAFCIYSLYLNKRHFFATFTSRCPLGKLRSSCSVMPRIRISMTK